MPYNVEIAIYILVSFLDFEMAISDFLFLFIFIFPRSELIGALKMLVEIIQVLMDA